MATNQAVIAALVKLKELEDSLGLEAHDGEHYFESADLSTAATWFHKAVKRSRERRRPILDRVYALGGTFDGVNEDALDALRTYSKRLDAIHEACADAYKPAERAEDYVTLELLANNQTCVEETQQKLRALITWAETIGPDLFANSLR
jgi:hypothetical protein